MLKRSLWPRKARKRHAEIAGEIPKTLGKSAVSKDPLRDPYHLARVRQQPCFICSWDLGCEAHHIRECLPRTMGVRVGDDKVVPLCSTCHRMLHSNSRAFWAAPKRALARAAELYAETLRLRALTRTP